MLRALFSTHLLQGRQFEVHYDGWPDEMNHWVDDDSSDIHPCGWAAKSGHPLMPPLTPQVNLNLKISEEFCNSQKSFIGPNTTHV